MTGWDEYRQRQAALRTAAQLASCAEPIEDALAARGFGGVFAGGEDLAREAQQKWWHRLLGRLDGDLGDDLAGMSEEARLDAVRTAWRAQSGSMPGFWVLANSGPRSRRMASDRDRYVALLALYAGRAEPTDDRATVVATGRELVRHLERDAERQQPALTMRGLRRLRRRRAVRADTKLQLIQTSSVLAGRSTHELVAISQAADFLDAAPGEALVANARPGQWWWFVLDGVVDVVAGERPVAELRAGESFGPEPRLVDHLAPLGLVARSSAEVLVARRPEFTALIADHPGLADVLTATGRATVPVAEEAAHEVSGEHRPLSRSRKAG